MNEIPPPARLGRVLDHETHQAYSRADHPKAQTIEQLIVKAKTAVEVCRVIELTHPYYHSWRQQNGGMQAEESLAAGLLRSSSG